MPNYYISPESAFDATADAIRVKTGSQAPIEWTEDGFADAVDAIPSGGGPDLSSDTVTAATLLEGVTAHDASGTSIVGELTGPDLLAGTLVITTNLTATVSVMGFLSWSSSSKRITGPNVFLYAGTDEITRAIPTSNTIIALNYTESNPIEVTNLSSGVTLINNGAPVPDGNNQRIYVRLLGSATRTLSFTVSSVVQEQEGE